jgi:hypothetical protein
MRYFSFTLGLMLVAASVARAADKPPKQKPPNKPPADAAPAQTDQKPADQESADQDEAADDETAVAEQAAALQKQKEIVKKYRATEDADERQKLLEEYRAVKLETPAKYAELAKKHPDSPAIFPVLQFLINFPNYTDEAIELISKHHLGQDEVGEVCLMLAMRGHPDAEKLIRRAIERSKSDQARGLAQLALGKLLSARADEAGLSDSRRDKLREEAKQALTTVSEKYADLDASGRNAGAWAKSILFELEHLAIGLPVPDLAGQDLEGAEFKLSDYRGKVVFLDFWAHW